ncbi:helix-turn-helix domain-containing protein [Bosea sp. RAC05]|uniref:helix-turn-helix domain-containing protein n=1 Tax=Bosea sp. RAC05 TaxID=1842539 RepID=UPI00083E236F|nr:helix-turn-helix domain-containing protein [Bosea sp. RAC05]AOG06665.1 merR HTH regulatory family protein [Bosea sp. RAC05]
MLLPDEVRPRLKNDEAAAALGVKPDTLKAWRSRGVGPAFVRVNGAIRYDPVDIAVYLGARRVEPRA